MALRLHPHLLPGKDFLEVERKQNAPTVSARGEGQPLRPSPLSLLSFPSFFFFLSSSPSFNISSHVFMSVSPSFSFFLASVPALTPSLSCGSLFSCLFVDRRRRRRAIRRRKRALLRRKLEKERAAHAAAAASVSSGGKDKSDDIVRSAKGAASGGAGGNEGNREGEGKGGAIEMDASLLEILDFESESESSSSDEDDQDGNDPEDGRFTVSDEFDEFDNDLEVGTPRLKGKKSGRRRKRGGQGGIGDAGVGDERNEDEDGYESREGRGLLGDRGDPLYHDRRGYEHPLRSVFCSYADAQVANYDHYCSIIATTVGEANHCRFWWFLFAATICNFVASKTVYSGFRFVPSVSLWFSFNGWHLFYALIYWSMFVTVFCLFLMHTWFALSNMNSNEFMRADKIPYVFVVLSIFAFFWFCFFFCFFALSFLRLNEVKL